MEVAPTHSIIPRVLMSRHFVSFVQYTSSVPLLVTPSMRTNPYFVTFADPKSESFRHVNRDVRQSKLCLPSLPDQPPLTKPRLGTIQSSSRSPAGPDLPSDKELAISTPTTRSTVAGRCA